MFANRRSVVALSALVVVVAVVSTLAGCSPAEPTPQPPPPPPPPPPAARTYMVSGWVGDTGARMISGARVEVITGTKSGTVVLSGDDGQYSFDAPLDANVRLRASKPGYDDDLNVVNGNASSDSQRIGFRLRSPNPPVDLTGHHRITFTADSTCSNLPPVARERSYLANVTSKVDLYGATFAGGDDTYLWRVVYLSQFEDYAHFWAQDPPVWELLPNNDFVVIYGDATGTVGPHNSTLTFAGFFLYCPRRGPGQSPRCEVEEIVCQSSRHQMSMTRRYGG
jgi:hypothetical protein